MLSYDDDFDNIVVSKRGCIVYQMRWAYPISTYGSMKHYRDFDSDMESPLKTTCSNEGTTVQFILSSHKTIPEFLMRTTSVGISIIHCVLSLVIVHC